MISNIDFITHKGYLSPIKGYPDYSHVETFTIKYNDAEHLIKFVHKFKSEKDIQLYQSMMNNFLNVNRRFVKKDSTVIDIGAYNGDTALIFAILCNAHENGRVYAFEPSYAFSTYLNINLGFNPKFSITPIPFAVAEKTGVQTFKYGANDDNGGHPSTNAHIGTYTIPRLVRTINFKEFLQKSNIDLTNISLIKTDTEGHDFDILDSFKDLIKKYRWTLHAEWFPGTSKKIQNLLEYMGYSMYCGFTLEKINVWSPWRQDIVLVADERKKEFSL